MFSKDDAPILISAIENSDFLLTLDKKDFLNQEVLEFAKKKKLAIVMPKEFLEII